jgi:hypothetical protein
MFAENLPVLYHYRIARANPESESDFPPFGEIAQGA